MNQVSQLSPEVCVRAIKLDLAGCPLVAEHASHNHMVITPDADIPVGPASKLESTERQQARRLRHPSMRMHGWGKAFDGGDLLGAKITVPIKERAVPMAMDLRILLAAKPA